MKKKIGILTGGGDCPGLNAVIRGVTKKAILGSDIAVVGIEDGYHGLITKKYRQLQVHDVSGILAQGGTILGTSNIANPFHYALKNNGKITFQDYSDQAISLIKKLGIECLVCIGGDGTLSIANQFKQKGVNVIGVPKTIDNDLKKTDITFGFNTAVQLVTSAIDNLHSTAQSHHRVMIIEVMGRKAGWIALFSGIAGGGDVILIPEIPYHIESVTKKVKERSKKGKRFSIIVVAEGAKPYGGNAVVRKIVNESADPVRLGGIGLVLGEQIEQSTGIETRTVVMGHLQRGGTPSAYDRILATRLGTKVVEMISNEDYGNMVAIRKDALISVPLEKVAQGPRLVPVNHELIASARDVGTCFGN